MDPCSLVCTIITIGGAGVAAGRSAKKLYDAVEDARIFEDIIVRIALEFQTFARSIEWTKHLLTVTTKEFPRLQMAEWLNKMGLAQNLELVSKNIADEIKTFTARFKRASEKGPLGFVKKLLWAFFHREDGQKFYPRMQLLSNYFTAVLQGLQLEILLASPSRDSPEIMEQLSQLKHLIKHQSEVIESLAFRFPAQAVAGFIGGGDASRSATSLAMEQLDLAKAILAMNKMARRSRTVGELKINLDKVTEGIASKSASVRSTSTDATRPRRRRHESQSIRVSHGTLNETEPASRTRPLQRAVVPEHALQRFEAWASKVPHTQSVVLQTDSEVSSPSTALSRETSSSIDQSAPSPFTPLSPVPPAASSFEDVREQKTYHTLVGLQSETIQGHITQFHWTGGVMTAIHVTARCYGEELDENFISVRLAQELGLDIQELDPEADGTDKMVLVTTEGDRLVHKHAIGTVDVRWWTTCPPGFRVRMWVMQGGLPEGTGIALGQPFEKKRRYYNGNCL